MDEIAEFQLLRLSGRLRMHRYASGLGDMNNDRLGLTSGVIVSSTVCGTEGKLYLKRKDWLIHLYWSLVWPSVQ